MLCFAICSIQKHCISSDKALQVLIAHQVIPKAHVPTVNELPAIRQPEKELHGSCSGNAPRQSSAQQMLGQSTWLSTILSGNCTQEPSAADAKAMYSSKGIPGQ